METELIPIHDSRQIFYRKARVITDVKRKTLISYSTEVCYIEDGVAVILGKWSNTTTRHIKEFLKQNDFEAENSNQMLKDYLKED